MKWLTAFLCLLAIPAAAQEQPIIPNVENLAIGIQCRPTSPSTMLEEQFGEIPMLQGGAIVLGSSTQVIPGKMMMFVNPETKSYTIGFNVNNELFCIVMSGGELQAAIQGSQL